MKTFEARRDLRAAFFAGVESVRPDVDDPSTPEETEAAWVEYRDDLLGDT